MFSKAKLPIKLLNLSKRIIAWLYTSLFWYAQQIINQLEGGSSVYDVQVPLKLRLLNWFMIKWLLSLYDNLRNSSDIIIKEFTMVGIKNTLMMELPLEYLFADLDA